MPPAVRPAVPADVPALVALMGAFYAESDFPLPAANAERAFAALLDQISEATVLYLNAQVDTGAHAEQLFDSWAGALAPGDYREHVLPHMKRIVRGVRPGVPVISFGTGTGTYLDLLAASGAHVVGVDWRTPLDVASARLGPDFAVQGNLDPAALFAPWPAVDSQVRRVVHEGLAAPGHVFNLGHGVLPETDPEVLTRVVDLVHEASRR